MTKWHGIVTPSLKLKEGDVWDKTHSCKEGAFIRSIWHKAVAVNAWRVMFIKDINNTCHMCMADILETIIYKIWDDYRIALRAWDYSPSIVNTMKANPGHKGPQRCLDW
jgi:hypothetical protein